MDRQTFKNAIMTAKSELKDAVAHKVALTRERVEYKLKTRGNIPENERRGWFQVMDTERSDAKYRIRHRHLAYGYLRGQDYKRMEPHTKYEPCAFTIAGNLERWLDKNSEHRDAIDIEKWIGGAPSPFARPPLSEAMKHYRSLERKLRSVRAEHGVDTPHEEPILDEMDKAWYALIDAEHTQLDGEGSTCFPKKTSEVAA
jgi:hypothetical protein